MVSSLSAAPAISFSVGSSGVSGIGGHQDSSAKVASASVSASVVSRSSSEEGSNKHIYANIPRYIDPSLFLNSAVMDRTCPSMVLMNDSVLSLRVSPCMRRSSLK